MGRQLHTLHGMHLRLPGRVHRIQKCQPEEKKILVRKVERIERVLKGEIKMLRNSTANIIYCILCVAGIAGMFYFAKAGQQGLSNMCQHLTILVCGIIFIPSFKARYDRDRSLQNLLYFGLLCFVEVIFAIMFIRTAVSVFL